MPRCASLRDGTLQHPAAQVAGSRRQSTAPRRSLPSAPDHVLSRLRRKVDPVPVDEDTRATIRAFCTGLVSALNRYYAFGS